MQSSSPRAVSNNVPPTNNSFPTIGTFTLESTSPQQNQIFSQPDFFNNSSQSNNSMNGGGGHHGVNGINNSSSSTYNSNNNSNSGDPNGATRETGIIEKLLVRILFLIFYCRRRLIFLCVVSLNPCDDFLSSTRMVLFNAVNVKLDCFFIFHNSVETLNI